MMRNISFSFVLLFFHIFRRTSFGFVPRPVRRIRHPSRNALSAKVGSSGEVGQGPNWIERSFPVDIDGSDGTGSAAELKKVEDYDLGISGVAFQTGPLSKRMFDVMMSKTSISTGSEEIKRGFTMYAMDFTAKEATRAALKQNGLEMVLQEHEEDEGMWGDIDSIRLLDPDTQEPVPGIYDSVEDAVDEWSPGQGFDFVVRQVPAKMRELSLDELLQALDPKGELREEAKAANMSMPDEGIASLKDLANDSVRRSESAPRGATSADDAFAGKDKRAYNVINRSDLLYENANDDGSEKHNVFMHVMDSFVSCGAAIVDVTDGGKNYEIAKALAAMWDSAEDFFEKVNGEDTSYVNKLPGMTTVAETGSQTAKVGYAAYDNESLQFLETRVTRSGVLLPDVAQQILGDESVSTLKEAFDNVCQIGKDLIRVAVAACSVEYLAFGEDEVEAAPKASKAAVLMANELVDDGTMLETDEIEHNVGTVSMSPHRLCRYTNNPTGFKVDEEEAQKESKLDDLGIDEDEKVDSTSREVFGAHIDSTFITAVPVAAVSGLEVFDEGEELWYRPELRARNVWEMGRKAEGKDPSALVEEMEDGQTIPWYARYVVFMPGELLQVVSRDEVAAAVHRVVATKETPSRLSAPILLRCRPGVKLDVERYLGNSMGNSVLEECDQNTIEQIHSALQPSTYQ